MITPEITVKPVVHLICASFAVLMLAACTDDTGGDGESKLLETQQQALERARDVEQDVAEAAQRQAREIERAEGGG